MSRHTSVLQSVVGICALSAVLSGSALAWELEYAPDARSDVQNEATQVKEAIPVDQDQSSCRPVGHVVYRLAGAEKETGEPTLGRFEPLTQATRTKHTLTVVTASGEKIEYPFATVYWAKVALEQLCTEQAAYLDMTGCKFEQDQVLFNDRACDSSFARREIYRTAPPELRAIGDHLDGDSQSLRIESLKYSCSRPWFFFPRYQEAGKDKILRRLPLSAPEFSESYRVFSRGNARTRAVSRALEAGRETLGLTRVSVISCGPPAWQDQTIY